MAPFAQKLKVIYETEQSSAILLLQYFMLIKQSVLYAMKYKVMPPLAALEKIGFEHIHNNFFSDGLSDGYYNLVYHLSANKTDQLLCLEKLRALYHLLSDEIRIARNFSNALKVVIDKSDSFDVDLIYELTQLYNIFSADYVIAKNEAFGLSQRCKKDPAMASATTLEGLNAIHNAFPESESVAYYYLVCLTIASNRTDLPGLERLTYLITIRKLFYQYPAQKEQFSNYFAVALETTATITGLGSDNLDVIAFNHLYEIDLLKKQFLYNTHLIS